MAKKWILGSLVLAVHVAVLWYWLLSSISISPYADELVSNKSDILLTEVNAFYKRVDGYIEQISSKTKANKYNDVFEQDLLLKIMESESSFHSIYLAKGPYKTYIARDKASVIMASDSTSHVDIVHWNRFEKSKAISQWEEFFDEKKYHIQHLNQVINAHLNQYVWLPHRAAFIQQEVMLLGKSWVVGSDTVTLALRLNREIIAKKLKEASPELKDAFVFMMNPQGTVLFLNRPQTEPFAHLHDSVAGVIYNDLIRFKSDSNRVFSVTYRNYTFWVAQRLVNPQMGVNSLLVALPNSSFLEMKSNSQNFGMWAYLLLLVFTIVGVLIWYLYSKRTKKIPSNHSIEELLSANENSHLEFKSSLRWDYRQNKTNPELEYVIMKTIAAFGNSDGGILLIGVDDDKNILGIEPDLLSLKKPTGDFFEIYTRNLLHKYFGVRYTSEFIRMDFLRDGANEICLIEVLRADEPVFLKTQEKGAAPVEKFYVRSGNSSQQMESLKDINDYIFSRFKKDSK